MYAFNFISLTYFASFLTCIFCSFNDDSFEASVERANTFFSQFGLSVSDKFQQISSQLAQVDELSSVCPSILSFNILAGDQLFAEVLVNSCNEDYMYQVFLGFFNDTIGLELDQIKRRLHSFDEYDFDPYVAKFASDLKDAIVSGVKYALGSIKIQRSNPISPSSPSSFISSSENESADFDAITVEFSKSSSCNNLIPAPKKIKFDDECMMNSLDSNSPKLTPDLAFESIVVLFYGIRSGHALFPVAKAYLQFLQENNLKIYNPNMLICNRNAQLAFNRIFRSGHPAFREFCHHVECSIIPITSPLYHGPYVSKAKISEVKKNVLINLAVEKMQQIVETFDSDGMVTNIQNQYPEIEREIIECFISHIREQALSFLLILNNRISFASGLRETINVAYKNISDVFCLTLDPEFSKIVVDTFLSKFESPLILIKRYDSLEDWKSCYDETSPTYKPKILSPIEESKSSGLKSVKIVEEKNQICFIDSIADIEREFIEKTSIAPIKRSPSKSSNLNELVEIDLKNSFSPMSIFEDSIRVVKDLSPIPASSKFSSTRFEMVLPSIKESSNLNNVENSATIFCISQVPDFPFQDPSEVVLCPDYITTTEDYFSKHGDNSYFMLDSRVSSIKQGVSTFLSKSFKNKKTSDSVMKIFEESLNKVFKS
jgi:hypothetical protein